MKDLLVSIVMPTYNCAKYIGESIDSIINQSYIHWELIIVDDCSSDDTNNIVQLYLSKDRRIFYHKLTSNSGAAIARNKGMNEAKGTFIAFLDSDDLWATEKLEKQINFMKDNSYAFTFTTYAQINEQGIENGFVVKAKNKVDYNNVLLSCPIGNSSVIYNCETLGKFEVPNIRKRNDDALWLKILKKEKYAFGLNETLMQYRVRRDSLSHNKFKLIGYHWYLYRNIEKLSVARSSYHIVCWILIKLLRIK